MYVYVCVCMCVRVNPRRPPWKGVYVLLVGFCVRVRG